MPIAQLTLDLSAGLRSSIHQSAPSALTCRVGFPSGRRLRPQLSTSSRAAVYLNCIALRDTPAPSGTFVVRHPDRCAPHIAAAHKHAGVRCAQFASSRASSLDLSLHFPHTIRLRVATPHRLSLRLSAPDSLTFTSTTPHLIPLPAFATAATALQSRNTLKLWGCLLASSDDTGDYDMATEASQTAMCGQSRGNRKQSAVDAKTVA